MQDAKVEFHSQALQSIAADAGIMLPTQTSDGGLVIRGKPTCSECGNKSKRDCAFQRCRTCCKNRGFDCATHVKSTWIPASKRRDRLPSDSSPNDSPQPIPRRKKTKAAPSSPAPPSPKMSPGEIPSVAIEPNLLPTELVAPTLLKSVRVTSLADGLFEFGYHAMVKVGGHVFKGVLYNSGTENSMLEGSILSKKSTPTPTFSSPFSTPGSGSVQKLSMKLNYYPEKNRSVRSHSKSAQSQKKNQELDQSQAVFSSQQQQQPPLKQIQDLNQNQIPLFESPQGPVGGSHINSPNPELDLRQGFGSLQDSEKSEGSDLNINQNPMKVDDRPSQNPSLGTVLGSNSIIHSSGISIVAPDDSHDSEAYDNVDRELS